MSEPEFIELMNF